MSDTNGHSDEAPKKRPLSEISHLFLSSIRDGMSEFPKPKRVPPRAPEGPANGSAPAPYRGDESIDLTPEEFAQVIGQSDAAHPLTGMTASPLKRPPVSAVIGAHLNGKQFDRVKEYARHLAGQIGRIGLIELDASEFRLMYFEPGAANPATNAEPLEPATAQMYDPRQMSEAIEEMSFDVDRWLLLLPNPRTPEARALLHDVDHWVLLSTCDHDGVVSSYRMLKGLAEARRQQSSGDQPSHLRLTLALLDGREESEMTRVVRKLAGVCEQFLGLGLEAESPVRRSYKISENLVLLCRPTRDKAQMANPPQWSVVAKFLAKNRHAAGMEGMDNQPAVDAEATGEMNLQLETIGDDSETLDADGLRFEPPSVSSQHVADVAVPAFRRTPSIVAAPVPEMVPAPAPAVGAVSAPEQKPTPSIPASPVVAPSEPMRPMSEPADRVIPFPIVAATLADEVLELDGAQATVESILATVLRREGSTVVECPVRAPMCAEARLAVGRDGGTVLLAVTRRGLAELQSIGQAYHWLSENLPLIRMAVPQFSIDVTLKPRLRLLVDQADISADVLRPILGSGNVTLQAYRKVRWGGRTGLLLEAA